MLHPSIFADSSKSLGNPRKYCLIRNTPNPPNNPGKINAEYEKNAAKIAELQARQKELDKQRTELENLDIVGMVRSMGMTPEELAALIEASKNGQMAPAMTEKEETGDEEI